MAAPPPPARPARLAPPAAPPVAPVTRRAPAPPSARRLPARARRRRCTRSRPPVFRPVSAPATPAAPIVSVDTLHAYHGLPFPESRAGLWREYEGMPRLRTCKAARVTVMRSAVNPTIHQADVR